MISATCPLCTPGAFGPVCDACLANAPMRRVTECACGMCGHEWLAPKLGRCPKCRTDETVEVGSHTNGLKRV